MKKSKLLVGVFCVFFLVLLMAACNQETTNDNQPNVNAEEGTVETSSEIDLTGENILLSTGSESGTVYPVGVQLAEFLQSMGAVATNTTGNAIVNLELMEINEADIGHSSSFLGFAAENGLEPFEGRKFENIRALAKLMDNTFQFVVLEDSGINSLEKVAEQQYPLTLGVSQPGSEAELTTRRVLEAYGITYDDIKDWGGRVEFGSHGDLGSLLRDGHIEAMAIVSSVPAAAVTEIDLQRPMKVLSLSDDIIKELTENFGYDISEVSDDVYKGQSNAATTLVGGLVFYAHKDLPDEIVYELTKFINEGGKERISSIHHQLEDYLTGSESTATGLGTILHPGAEQYYKDAGIID
ncbi:TAXI family TRAP transporter solute-binding subunit [Oceanobacillus saliphilus]|uniref:TAXI family TRAP transporter solute-binding subunit n=1 Tax=Oceanobacillus saliphilus TaxID=2925834 RepID=UPI00201E39A3|nr:TAXI family TRAP transporter solute-binding subunit [Oceanobacillus saliphilus]